MGTLPREFYACHHLELARALLGTELFAGRCAGRVVETEGYAFEGDPACHTFSRPSMRLFVGKHPPGTSYCYLNYGIHWLFNVLAADGVVLVRALEPTKGLSLMRQRRQRERMEELCSGPGKLGQALGLNAASNGLDLVDPSQKLGFRAGSLAAEELVSTGPRIGISKAVDRPWRFWLKGHPCVSR